MTEQNNTTKKNSTAMSDEEAFEIALENLIRRGEVALCGTNQDGEAEFALTLKGRQVAELDQR
jgi:hypothetical protein